jgi:hypothetical protein
MHGAEMHALHKPLFSGQKVQRCAHKCECGSLHYRARAVFCQFSWLCLLHSLTHTYTHAPDFSLSASARSDVVRSIATFLRDILDAISPADAVTHVHQLPGQAALVVVGDTGAQLVEFSSGATMSQEVDDIIATLTASMTGPAADTSVILEDARRACSDVFG